MKLQMRLVLSYTVLALIAAAVLGISYNRYNTRQYENKVYNNVQYLSSQLVNNFENSESLMEQVASLILSDQDTLMSIRHLSSYMREEDAPAVEMNEARTIVRRKINTTYNMDHFHRVVVFNDFGFIASSVNAGNRLVDTVKVPQEISWLENVKGSKGKYILIGEHLDDWGLKEHQTKVFSIVKEIQGDRQGYIEVQRTTESLKEEFTIPDQKYNVVVQTGNGDTLYSSKGVDARMYSSFFEMNNGLWEEKNKINGKKELCALLTSEQTGCKILVIQDWEELMQAMPNTSGMVREIVGIFLLFSLIFITVTANYLTKPIRKLRRIMENTQLSDIYEEINIKSSDEDICALTKAYQELLRRLGDSMNQEKKLALMQLQAQFDTLQAQVNPHFIYNVLNVIAGQAMEYDDEKICRICDNLAAMLRYSTNTKSRQVTLRQEEEYLRNYIFILKARYEDRLQISIEIEESIRDIILPKIVLQQMVENCIQHGYSRSAGIMEIFIRGVRVGDGWQVNITDNGEGISEEARSDLMHKIEVIRNSLGEHQGMIEMEIGKMGLANNFGRMYVLYKEHTVFDLHNRKGEKGTIAIIGGTVCIR